ncbi:POLA1 [Acanthosepion pharaonis]|uniref:DNA-directed DNA polymerase n=1 Tax=Acanthosepion pharaonis TaxID=158019 RepID=A0A812DR75_ACAPH|nr:POLA1 [Sepia pharaonis]
MVNTNCTDYKEVYKLGKDIKTDINKRYRLLEIDIDGIYKSMLLLKKKKYAAIKITKDADGKIIEEQELKGLDIVRRDWCDLAKNAGNFVVQQILSGQNRESVLENIHLKLSEVGEKVCKNELPVDLYLITKQLTKDPEDYPNKKSLPHVQVAMRINSKGGKKMKAGDTVPYLICKDGSNLGHSQRAYHPDELAKNGDLSIDSHYYLAQQIHPVVMRLCDPIEGTDAAILAECLGLDPTSYRRSLQQNEDDGDDALLGFKLNSEERFKDCEKFKVKCPSPSCGTDIVFDCSNDWSLDRCANQSCSLAPKTYIDKILNQLVITMRKHIKQYYQGWMQCDDPICATEVRKNFLIFSSNGPLYFFHIFFILFLFISDSHLSLPFSNPLFPLFCFLFYPFFPHSYPFFTLYLNMLFPSLPIYFFKYLVSTLSPQLVSFSFLLNWSLSHSSELITLLLSLFSIGHTLSLLSLSFLPSLSPSSLSFLPLPSPLPPPFLSLSLPLPLPSLSPSSLSLSLLSFPISPFLSFPLSFLSPISFLSFLSPGSPFSLLPLPRVLF